MQTFEGSWNTWGSEKCLDQHGRLFKASQLSNQSATRSFFGSDIIVTLETAWNAEKGPMGNQQSGDTASQSVSTASSEPLPTLLGHTRPTGPDVERAKSKPAEIEVELPDVPDADDAVDCKDIFGPQLFTMSVPFLIVLSVSALLPVPDKWEISFVSLRLGV